MTVTLKSKDGQAIRKLIPLTTLPESAFNNLCTQIRIEEGPKGTVLFKQGDHKNEFVYLLEGTISLQAAGMEMDTITGGSEEARFALAHQIPRKVFAVAKDKIRFIRVNAEILNSTTSKQQNSVSYEVSDIPEESSDDWMTMLLKSPIFQRLPAANLQKVLTSMEEIEVNAGELVVKQGEVGDYYYIIKRGRCSLTRKPSPNAKEIKLAELKTTETFGEDSLISGSPRNVNITMLTNGVLLRLSKENFLELIKKPVIQSVSIDEALEATEKGAILLDVRTPDIFEHGHIEGSLNVPFFSLRMQIPNLDPAKKLIVVCEDGTTSEAASFLLIRYTFDAVVLQGGFDAVPDRYLDSCDRNPKLAAAETSPAESAEDMAILAADEKQALDEARQIIGQLQRQLQEEQEKRKSAEQDQRRQSASGVEDRSASDQALKAQIEKLNREVRAALNTAETYRKRLEQAEQKLTGSNQAADRAQQESGRIASEMNGKLQSLESDLHRSQAELDQALKNSAEDRKQIESLCGKLKDQERQLSDLSAAAKEKSARLEKEIAAKNVIEANLSRIQKEASNQAEKLGEKAGQAEEQAEKARQTITELQQQLDQSRQSCALLEKQNAELADSRSGEVESLVGEKQAFEKEAADLKHRLARIIDEKQRIESEAREMTDQLQKNLQEIEQQVEEKNRDLEAAQTALSEQESLRSELQKRIDQLSESAAAEKKTIEDNLKQEVERLENELDASRREQEKIQETLETSEARQAALSDECDTGRNALEALKQSFSESEAAYSTLQQEKLDLESEIDRIKLDWAARQENSEQSHKELSDQLRSFESENRELRSMLEGARLSEEKLGKEIADLTALGKSLEEDARREQSELKNELAAVRKQRDALENAKSGLDGTLAERAAEAGSLRQELQSTCNRISGLESEISDLTLTVESKTAELQSTQEALDKSIKAGQEHQETLDQLSANHESTVLDAENERNAFQIKIADLEQSLEQARNELKEAGESRDTTETDYRSAMQEIKRLQQDKTDLDKKVDDLSNHFESKNRELESLQEQLGQSQKSAEGLQHKFDEISEKYEQALLLTENLQSDFQQQVETFENRLAQAAEDLEETRRSAGLATEERDALDLKTEQMEAENVALKQDLEGFEQQVKELRNLVDHRQEEITSLEESHSLQMSGADARQAELEEEVAALSAENAEIQERMASKAGDLTGMEEKLFAIRKENAVLERRLDSLKKGGLDAGENTSSRIGELESEVGRLMEQNQAAISDKTKALTKITELREQNSELETAVHSLREQLDSGYPQEQAADALKAELEMIRSQAESDIQTIKAQLVQSQNNAVRLDKELKAERERVAELENSGCEPLSLNPAFTAVDSDVFDMVEEEEIKASSPVQQRRVGMGFGKVLAACLLSGVVSVAGAGGFLLGTESGRSWLGIILDANLPKEMALRPNHAERPFERPGRDAMQR